MEASQTDAREQLSRLRIRQDQRPVGRTSGGARTRWRPPWWLIAVVLLGGVGYWQRDRLGDVAEAHLSKPPTVRLVTVTQKADTSPPPQVTATGKIVSDHRVQVATKVSGQIIALFFEQGDFVKKGQIIAKIEDVNYRARRDQAAANLARTKAMLAFAKANYDRLISLRETGNAPAIEFDEVKSAHQSAEAQVRADEAMLSEAEWRLENCEVEAPIEGVVLDRNVEVGDFVAAEGGFGGFANSQFATIADMTKLRVEVDISELDITKITKDMPCGVTPDAYKDRHYHGHVMWIDPAANYSKATVQVKVRIEDPDTFLRVEGTARVDFLTLATESLSPGAETMSPGAHPMSSGQARSSPHGSAANKPSIWLNKAAVLIDAATGSGAVFAFDSGRIHRRPVTIGRKTDTRVEIVAGIVPGDRIVAEPTKELKDGQQVEAAG